MDEDELVEFSAGFDGSGAMAGLKTFGNEVSDYIETLQAKFDSLGSTTFSPKSSNAQYFGNLEKSIDSLGTKSESLLGHLDRMSGRFTSGLGLGVAVGGFALLEGAFDRGIQKAREFQTAQISIAATLTSVGTRIGANGKALSQPDQFTANLQYAKDLQQRLLDASTKNHLKFEEQVGAFQSSIASGARKGMNIDQIFEISDLGAMAAKSLNLHGEQIANATRLLTGGGVNVGRSTIGRALGITNQDISSRSGDDLYKFLEEKLKGFKAAQNEFGTSIEGIISTIESKVDTLMARVGMRFFNAVRPTIARFLDVFDDPKKGQGAGSGSNGTADPNETEAHYNARVEQHQKDAEALNKLTDAASDMFVKIFNALSNVMESGQFQAFVSGLEFLAGFADKLVLGAVFGLVFSNISKAQKALAGFETQLKSLGNAKNLQQVGGGLLNGGIYSNGRQLTAEELGWNTSNSRGTSLQKMGGLDATTAALQKEIWAEPAAEITIAAETLIKAADATLASSGGRGARGGAVAEDYSLRTPRQEGESWNAYQARAAREKSEFNRQSIIGEYNDAVRTPAMDAADDAFLATPLPGDDRFTPEHGELGFGETAVNGYLTARQQRLINEAQENLPEPEYGSFNASERETADLDKDNSFMGRMGALGNGISGTIGPKLGRYLAGFGDRLGASTTGFFAGQAIDSFADSAKPGTLADSIGHGIGDTVSGASLGFQLAGPEGALAGGAIAAVTSTFVRSMNAAADAAQNAADALANFDAAHPDAAKISSDQAQIRLLQRGVSTHQTQNNFDIPSGTAPGMLLEGLGLKGATEGALTRAWAYVTGKSPVGDKTDYSSDGLTPAERQAKIAALESDIAHTKNIAESRYETNYNPQNDAIARIQEQLKAEGSDENFTYAQKAKRAMETGQLNDLLIGQQYAGYKGTTGHYDDETSPGWMAANSKVVAEAADKNSPMYRAILARQKSEGTSFGNARSEQEQAAIDNILSPHLASLEAADKAANDSHAAVEQRGYEYTSLGLEAGNNHNEIGQKFYEALDKATKDAADIFGDINTGKGKAYIQTAVDNFFKYGIAESIRDQQEKVIAVQEAGIDVQKAIFDRNKLPMERQKMLLGIAGESITDAETARQIAAGPHELNNLNYDESIRQRSFNRDQQDEPERETRDQFGIDNANYAQQDFFAGMDGGIGKMAAAIRRKVDSEFADQFDPVAYENAYRKKVQDEIENLKMDKTDATKKAARDKEDNADKVAKFAQGSADFIDKLNDLMDRQHKLILEQAQEGLSNAEAANDLHYFDATSGIMANANVKKAQLGLGRAQDALAQSGGPGNISATIAAAHAAGYSVPASVSAYESTYRAKAHAALTQDSESTQRLHRKISSHYDQNRTSKNSQHHDSSTHTINVPVTVTAAIDPKMIQEITKKGIKDYCETQRRKAN